MPDIIVNVNADGSVKEAVKDKWHGEPFTKKLKAKKDAESNLIEGSLYLPANPSQNEADAIDATIVAGGDNSGLAGSTLVTADTNTTCRIINNKLV